MEVLVELQALVQNQQLIMLDQYLLQPTLVQPEVIQNLVAKEEVED
jgi:hypothetical protein